MITPVIEVRELSKTYGDVTAVDRVSFEVMPGEIFGLLGPNGAGKTTTLEILEGLRAPDSGRLTVAGIDPAVDPEGLRRVMGVQLQSSGLPPTMAPYEAMEFFCAYLGVAPRYDLLERFGLSEKGTSEYSRLSSGQKQRLALALAVAHRPPVVLLDEPTAGLDVESRSELHRLLVELGAAGTTILLATHDMAEAEVLANRVGILLGGQLVTVGTPLEITATGRGLTRISVRTEKGVLAEATTRLPGVSRIVQNDPYTRFFSREVNTSVPAILDYLKAAGDSLIDLRVERPSLEERFLEITRKGELR